MYQTQEICQSPSRVRLEQQSLKAKKLLNKMDEQKQFVDINLLNLPKPCS